MPSTRLGFSAARYAFTRESLTFQAMAINARGSRCVIPYLVGGNSNYVVVFVRHSKGSCSADNAASKGSAVVKLANTDCANALGFCMK